MYGDGSSERDYTYVDDIIEGVVRALDRMGGYHIYNLGESRRISLADLIALIESEVGSKAEIREMPGVKYSVFKNGEAQAAGMIQMTEEWGDLPSHWMVYFAVADCDATAEKARTLSGEIKVPPPDIPAIGRFSAVCDPQGAVFSIIKLEPAAK